MVSKAKQEGTRRVDEREAALTRALAILPPVLVLARHDFLDHLRSGLIEAGIVQAVAARDTPVLLDWLVGLFQLQGISDRNAFAFTAQHGPVRWRDIEAALAEDPACSRLRSYWRFACCSYRKSAQSCSEPELLSSCPLPRIPLRNGRLSQGAYSLFLFIRDVCDGDLVGWIDDRLQQADIPLSSDRAFHMRNALLEPLSAVYGVSNKVLSMALADLLLAADPNRERWVTTGASMIAVDTLVHNFLHRTGILRHYAAEHPYGSRCYAPGGCAEIIEGLAHQIDAREFNPAFPAVFPRFVQHAIWSFCAADGWNICNGNKIDDRKRCQNQYCPAFDRCERLCLRPEERWTR